MLRIPSFRNIGDLTVYQDDAVWTRFYLVPSIPTIRRDAEDHPVFLLTTFQTDEPREGAAPGAARGGGYLNFDVQFAVDPDAREAARLELQKWVAQEYAKRRTDPQYSRLPDYAAPNPPPVEFADPLLSGGTVSMHTTQSSLLVTGRFAEAPASLVSGSTAVFNLDLTPEGAEFMHDLFVGAGGSGRVDLTPVQVIYALKMWARLPPVTITVKGDSSRIQQTLNSLAEKKGDNVCTPAEIETFRQTGINSAMLRENGIVEVKIDKGDATVPDAVLDALQQYALNLFDTMIKERFLVPADKDEEALGFDDMKPLAGPALYTLGRRRSLPTTRYKVRQSINVSTMHLEIRIDRSQVVEWPTGGQATLETFFSGMTPEQLRRYFVDLTLEAGKSLNVSVRAIVDFDKQPIQAVEVQTEYTATDENGGSHTATKAFVFRKGETSPGQFNPTILGGKREYRYRHRVVYADGTAGNLTEWETTTSPAVTVAIANPGKLDLEVSGASLNWDVVKNVVARLAYDAPGDGGERLKQDYELTKLTPVRKWEHQFNGALSGNVKVGITYGLADGKVIEGPTQTVDVTDTLCVVPPPQVDVLNVTLVPAGIWTDVAQLVASMQYDAGDGRIYDKVVPLTSLDQTAEWTVLLRDPTRRTFRYKKIITYKTGATDQTGWLTEEGDQALVLNVPGVPRLRVNVLANLVDFARTPAVAVSLAYGNERTTLAFDKAGTSSWEVPLAADGGRQYIYTVTYHPIDGPPVPMEPQRTADTQLIIPRAQLQARGTLDVLVRGFALDFAATPYVDVALVWCDGALEERKTVTLSRDQPNTAWSVAIGNRTQRKYHYAITYNLADGTRVPGAQGETDDPVVSVTRYRPQ